MNTSETSERIRIARLNDIEAESGEIAFPKMAYATANAQQVVAVDALGGLLVRKYVVARVRFALLIRRRN
jgi:hypothetical protein